MKKHSPLFALTLIALLFLAVACGPKPVVTDTPEPTAPPTEPPVVADFDLPASVDRAIPLDPATTTDADTLLLCNLVYDGLTRLDEDGQAQPALALSWTVSDDQLDYVLTLRQGVTFHDGTTFDADVVLANFNRWFDPADPLHTPDAFSAWQTEFLGFLGELDDALQPLATFDGIEKVDNYTVLIHLNRPVPDLMTKLAQPAFLMLDPLLLATAGESYGTSPETTNGTGAFVPTAWGDAGLELTPNAASWGSVPAAGLQIDWK
jgi:peptide/nickel transport system substrate-binding protein